MNLYNIHTHKMAVADNEICILNAYPQNFHAQKVDLQNVWYSCGIHPWYINDVESDMDLLGRIAREEDRVVAIGEAGLDKLQGPDMDIQIDVFRRQIELASQVQKPLIIHCVKAWDELIALYKEYKPDVPWIIHGYRGNAEQTKQLSRIGFKFSIGEKFNTESMQYIPQDSLFCETDMSAFPISHIYTSVQEVLDVERCHFVDMIEENTKKNFKILTK